MSDEPTVTDMMVAYAQDAVEMAQSNFGVELDYSEASIEKVEGCLAQLHDAVPKGIVGRIFQRGPSSQDVETAAKMFGGYLGEVFRKHHGGAWLLEPPPGSRAPIVLLEHSSGGRFFPTAKVFKRLTNGAEDNVWLFYQVLTREYIQSS